MTQISKAEAFQQLHQRAGVFVIPNPWDAGSAKMLTNMGFEALATTSGGLAFSLGKVDAEGQLTREETLRNAREIVDATDLPVAADLENGYAEEPEACAETIRLAALAGLVGGSIEDATGNNHNPIYPFDLSVSRIKAAVKAVKGLNFPFLLTARAENLIHGIQDLDDTIKRLVAYAEAGADVLFAPGLQTLDQVDAVVKAVSPKPVNLLMSAGLSGYTLEELGAHGVKRISLGSLFPRVAYGAFLKAAGEVKERGAFTFTAGTMTYPMINDMLRPGNV
jgi:2-methylisocitrate lyase-like PEP mutase family enzyme